MTINNVTPRTAEPAVQPKTGEEEKEFQSMQKQIGELLATLRRSKGYRSYESFAIAHHLPRIQYWRLEKGRANFTLRTLVTVLKIHKLGLDEFFRMLYHPADKKP